VYQSNPDTAALTSVCNQERKGVLRETVLFKLPTHFGIGLPCGQLCGIYSIAAVLYVKPAASVGSLAVISQPTFLPFIKQWLICLVCLYLYCLCLPSLLFKFFEYTSIEASAYVHYFIGLCWFYALSQCLLLKAL
jgi:hypothetical protein